MIDIDTAQQLQFDIHNALDELWSLASEYLDIDEVAWEAKTAIDIWVQDNAKVLV